MSFRRVNMDRRVWLVLLDVDEVRGVQKMVYKMERTQSRAGADWRRRVSDAYWLMMSWRIVFVSMAGSALES